MTTITLDGTMYSLTGPETAPVVILIHGLGLNKNCWQWMIPDLVDRYRILNYDLYGHGGSRMPNTTPNPSLFSEQLGALLNHCAITNGVIVGFSLGGMIARRFAQDAPDRAQ